MYIRIQIDRNQEKAIPNDIIVKVWFKFSIFD
jgi:hypothetical protein